MVESESSQAHEKLSYDWKRGLDTKITFGIDNLQA